LSNFIQIIKALRKCQEKIPQNPQTSKSPDLEKKDFHGAIYDKQYGMENKVKAGATITMDSTTAKFCYQNGLFFRIRLRSYCKTLFLISLPENRKNPVKYPG